MCGSEAASIPFDKEREKRLKIEIVSACIQASMNALTGCLIMRGAT